jgi:hypothetical protein
MEADSSFSMSMRSWRANRSFAVAVVVLVISRVGWSRPMLRTAIWRTGFRDALEGDDVLVDLGMAVATRPFDAAGRPGRGGQDAKLGKNSLAPLAKRQPVDAPALSSSSTA